MSSPNLLNPTTPSNLVAFVSLNNFRIQVAQKLYFYHENTGL